MSPSRPLRAELIEAAEAEIEDWRLEGETKSYGFAVAALDAILDTLADRADEWMMQALIAAYGNVRGGERLDADDLIAVLRGDTGER